MRRELKDKLDQEVKRKKRNWFLGLLAVMIPFLIYGLLFIPISSSTVQGEAVGLTAVQTEVGSLPRMRVKLNSGKIVRARMTQQQSFVSGARVSLQERKGLLGYKRYYVLSYQN